ncbi:hypothetical protein BKA83DRAFT_4124293 [Pisolithus microcarpus]|nr:hypothetical protein BKA83DRAFT_4124293 [Pisolithus microcarpus]
MSPNTDKCNCNAKYVLFVIFDGVEGSLNGVSFLLFLVAATAPLAAAPAPSRRISPLRRKIGGTAPSQQFWTTSLPRPSLIVSAVYQSDALTYIRGTYWTDFIKSMDGADHTEKNFPTSARSSPARVAEGSGGLSNRKGTTAQRATALL